jgi:hypothetical protein
MEIAYVRKPQRAMSKGSENLIWLRSFHSIAPMWHRSLCLGKRQNFRKVIKAASDLYSPYRDTFTRKSRGDKSMM